MQTAIFLLATLTIFIATKADAATRTFFAPSMYGEQISACTGEGTVCGKPVADQLCTSRGFAQALTFRLDRTDKANIRMRTVENELTPANANEPSFVFVKCYAPEVQATLTSE
ncbi:MAG: hypothetical protein ACR2OJ_09875 [Hyphomicrobiales bacterium]